MKRNVIATSFSISMIEDMIPVNNVSITEVPPEALPADLYSMIWSRDNARFISGVLGREIPVSRETPKVKPGDTLYVARYIGPGLYEWETQIRRKDDMKFYKVTF